MTFLGPGFWDLFCHLDQPSFPATYLYAYIHHLVTELWPPGEVERGLPDLWTPQCRVDRVFVSQPDVEVEEEQLGKVVGVLAHKQAGGVDHHLATKRKLEEIMLVVHMKCAVSVSSFSGQN